MSQAKIYVGNLSYDVTQEKLHDYFSQFGEVKEAILISDKFSGRSKGFGFVEYVDADSAQHAIEKTDGQEYEGRTLKVNIAREERSGGGGGRRRDNNHRDRGDRDRGGW